MVARPPIGPITGLEVVRRVPTVFKIEQFRDWALSYPAKVKKSELTPEQVSSVPCPACGAIVGEPCVLLSGAPRSEPHVERKYSALAAAERKSG